MRYSNIIRGEFISRPNRFIAKVLIDGKEETVHVKNTGRCRELLVPGARVYLEKSDNPARKTAYDLVAVKKGSRMINMDSQIPNAAAEEWIRSGAFKDEIVYLKREVVYGDSRFDLYLEYMEDGIVRKAFMEVKGVTLEDNGVVRFPDAPTKRGIKHLNELAAAAKNGYEAYILFVIQMKDVLYFEADRQIHSDFADALKTAAEAGVHVLAYDCDVTADNMVIRDPVKVLL
ncbi:DNA/RNA nuclease SfsA [Butyrivibrio sp. MC2013]|uniref:DNA/RNA nuclease SfsA n=1 Tax=Butyrivibrio sp. MC2013 TaxID=1280686 RepID=UPI00040F5A19|nr:DNA/RNA nuclease SfsA [Butyrivibrio sp. MC2013]